MFINLVFDYCISCTLARLLFHFLLYSMPVFSTGTVERTPTDCRTDGCGKNAECIREGAAFVCRCLPGTAGRAEVECYSGRTSSTLQF